MGGSIGPKGPDGRAFVDYPFFKLLRRTVTGLASNHAWLYSVDEVEEAESRRVLLRVVRWKAGFQDGKRVWRKFRSYNVRSSEQWDATSTAVDAYLQGSKMRPDPGFEDAFQPLEPLPQATKDTKGFPRAESRPEVGGQAENGLAQRLSDAVAARAAEASARRKAHSRLRAMKKHVGEYRRVLNDFKSVVHDKDSNETQVHDFISAKNPFWLFGLEYLGLESKVGFPPRKPVFWFDLMLHRMDGFYDLVELKGPNEQLFDKRTTRRAKLNHKLSEALGQVIAYLEACDRTRQAGLFKPKAVIVIGTKQTDDPRQRRLLASHLAGVEVLTYTQLVQRGTQLIQHLEGWKS